MRLVGDHPALLDTRGFIKYRRGDLKGAREDIEKAVASWANNMATHEAQQLSGVRSFQSEWSLAANKHSHAVMLYHRALVFERMGLQIEGALDRERVRKLGFEPNDELF